MPTEKAALVVIVDVADPRDASVSITSSCSAPRASSGLMKLYCTYYEQSSTHLSLNKDTPIPRPIATGAGRVVAIPQVGGLHHRYERQAA